MGHTLLADRIDHCLSAGMHHSSLLSVRSVGSVLRIRRASIANGTIKMGSHSSNTVEGTGIDLIMLLLSRSPTKGVARHQELHVSRKSSPSGKCRAGRSEISRIVGTTDS